MKKFLIALIMSVCALCASAQTFSYRTTGFAIKENTYYGWGAWSDWQSSDILITINMDTDVITIYSPVTQCLKAVEGPYEYVDASGGTNAKFKCYDLVDDIWCSLRLRIEANGNAQIYLEYANIMYVYNVVRL